MESFEYENPTRIVFGKGTIGRLTDLVPRSARVLLTYGGGSIRANGVYDAVREALREHTVLEFGGIEPNPLFETLMKAVALSRREGIDFLLAVGGGSVVDGAKFVAAAAPFEGADPWDILAKWTPISRALPLGVVLTLPATGSESNGGSVVSRAATHEKLFFRSEHVFPRFAILDPETTYSLSERQTRNGIVDAFTHVVEQYVTWPADAPLQDRQAEAILRTLVEEGPKVLANSRDYEARANVMWCATQALNGLIGVGVPQDWTTHMIGHELTALWGVDHAQSLAIVLPGVWRHQRERKRAKLLQYGERVWGISSGSEADRVEAAIDRTVGFYHSLGVKTAPADYGIPEDGFPLVAERLGARGARLGEHADIGPGEILAILRLC